MQQNQDNYSEGQYLAPDYYVTGDRSLPSEWANATPNTTSYYRRVIIPQGNGEFAWRSLPINSAEYRSFGRLSRNHWEEG